jgi:hypothetical protein
MKVKKFIKTPCVQARVKAQPTLVDQYFCTAKLETQHPKSIHGLKAKKRSIFV